MKNFKGLHNSSEIAPPAFDPLGRPACFFLDLPSPFTPSSGWTSSFGTPCSSILVVLGFFVGGWDPSAEDCLFFSELAPSSIREVWTASGGGP